MKASNWRCSQIYGGGQVEDRKEGRKGGREGGREEGRRKEKRIRYKRKERNSLESMSVS